MNKQSPFKLLEPYRQNERDIFFGREEETESLYKMVYQTNLTLVYGQSGTGKTSLIQCGLANKFDASDWFHISIRRNKDINESLRSSLEKYYKKRKSQDNELIQRLLKFRSSTAAKSKPGAGQSSGNKSIVELVEGIYGHYMKPVYLLFDQFEELFIFGSAEEQQEFYESIDTLLDSVSYCKAIFIMREEYIARLNRFERVIPELFEKRLRVEPMSNRKTREVIVRSCEAFNIEIGEESVPDSIIARVAGKDGVGLQWDENFRLVELPYLQVFLDRLWNQAMRLGGEPIVFNEALLQEVGTISDVLREFLGDRLRAFETEFGSRDQGVLFLKAFVSAKGTKAPRALSDIPGLLPDYNAKDIESFLRFFIANRLIRPLENSRFEMAHDSIAQHIADYTVAGRAMPQIQLNKQLSDIGALGFTPFTEDMAGEFFGRDDETKMLFDKVVNSPGRSLTLLYGPLSAGKTSLVRAGLVPRVGDLYDVYYHALSQSFFDKFLEGEVTYDEFVEFLFHEVEDTRLPDLIILDQFEEFYMWCPTDLRERLFNKLAKLIKEPERRHFLLVLREQYFAKLSDLEQIIPTIFDNRMRLEPMSMSDFKSVARSLARLQDLEFESEDVLENFIDKARIDGEVNLGVLLLLFQTVSQQV